METFRLSHLENPDPSCFLIFHWKSNSLSGKSYPGFSTGYQQILNINKHRNVDKYEIDCPA